MIITGSGIVIQGNVRIVGITVVPTPTDAQFNYVTALFYGDGANTAQNNTFLDSSSNNSSITRTGTPTQGSFSPYGNNWSNYFGTTTSNFKFATSASFAIGTGNFTVQCSVNFSAWSGTNQRIVLQGVSGTNNIAIYRDSGADNLVIQFETTTVITYAWTPTIGQWYHLAVVRSGTGTNQVVLYIDGVSVATGTSSASIAQNQFIVGGLDWASGYSVQGYISNLRYSNTARAITVPTSPYTSDANTIILTCQSNRFVDNSSNAFAITVNSTPSIQRFNPFGNGQIAYTTSTIGGSAYFNGSGDYLTTPQNAAFNFSTGAFTVEAWVYYTGTTVNSRIVGLGAGAVGGSTYTGWTFNINSSLTTINWYRYDGSTETNLNVSYTFSLNTWYHVVAVRNGSSNLSMYVNGTRVYNNASASLSYNNINSDPLYVGAVYDGASGVSWKYFSGYISNIRVVAGTAVYDPSVTTLTVPTAPLTTVTNTNLLLSFSNAGIYDSAAMNDVITVGSAQASTSVVKYGISSLKFNGTTDYLTIPYGNFAFEFGSGNYTIEFWLYALATTGSSTVFAKGNPGSISTDFCSIEFQGNQLQHYVCAYSAGAPVCAAVGITWANTWHHVAVVRNVNTWTMYVDGVAQATTVTSASTITATTSPNPSYMATSTYSTSRYFSGYIDDFRVTKGYARYTTAFTPPTAALLGF
jgi:hypothetical protein